MTGDNDFHQIGQGGWLGGGNRVPVCAYLFLSVFQFSMFMNFGAICLATEMAAGMKWETNLIPLALNRPPPVQRHSDKV